MLFSDKVILKLKENEDPELHNALERIIRSAERMQMLINDLLKLSRNMQTEDDFTVTDLNAILQDVLADLEPELQRRKATVAVASLPTIVGGPKPDSAIVSKPYFQLTKILPARQHATHYH